MSGVAKNKGTDQPARLRSLISALIIQLLEIIISKLATSDFFLVCLLVGWFEYDLVRKPIRQVFSLRGIW